MNILIINQPLNNRGDESAHKALLRSIIHRMPEAKIRVVFTQAKDDSVRQFNVGCANVEYININNVSNKAKYSCLGICLNLPLLYYLDPIAKEYLKHIKWCDYVISSPGGICMGGFQNWGHILYLKLAKLMNKPIAYYGRSFGPFPTTTWRNRCFKKASLEMLNYFFHLSIRDSKTEQLAKELGFTNYITTVDTAFLDAPVVEFPKDIVNQIGSNDYVVFVPNLLIWHYAYKGRVSKETILTFFGEVYKLIKQYYSGHKVVMLPQTFNYGTYEGDDINFFNDLHEFVGDNDLIVIDDIYSSDVQQTIISKAKCMIGARYHSVVFALNQAIPFVALSYEHKISGLLQTLGKSDCMVDITKAFDNEETIKATLELIKNRLSNAHSDIKARNEAKSIANNCFERFLDSSNQLLIEK